MRRLGLWGPPILYMLLIYRFSSESNPIPVVTSHVQDKVLHTAEYAALAMLFARALAGEGFRHGQTCLHALMLAAAYGVLDEFHQWFVPMRTSDVLDWIADVGGAAVGALSYAGAWLQAAPHVTRMTSADTRPPSSA
jgi:VanZ family protein